MPNCCGQWRNWVRPLLITFYVCVLLVAVPLLIVEFNVHGLEAHLQGWFIGGIFVLLTIPISLWGILQHLVHYTHPTLQRHIVRILWMVPIYSINAWFGLRFVKSAIFLDTMRECYEAYVIYNFMVYLLVFLRSEHPDLEEELEDREQQKHLFPFCLCPPWAMGKSIISKCRHGVLQYTVIRPVTTVIALICQLCGAYKDGSFSPASAWLYLTLINNLSQMWAMYCLILFYQATKRELAPLKPISKFLCVKAVVFMSFWQSVLIAGLVELKVITDTHLKDITAKDIGAGLQDFCICIEMFLASIAHYYSFSHKPYIDYAQGYGSCFQSFLAMFNVSDVRADVVEHVRHVGSTARKAVTRRPPATDSERQPILSAGPPTSEEDEDAGRLLRSFAAIDVEGYPEEGEEEEEDDDSSVSSAEILVPHSPTV